MEREKKRNWPVGRQVTLHLTAPSPRAAASVAVRPSRRHLQPSRVTEFFYRLLPGGRPRIRSFQRPPSRSSGGVPGFYRVFSLIRWGFQSITGFCRVLIDLSQSREWYRVSFRFLFILLQSSCVHRKTGLLFTEFLFTEFYEVVESFTEFRCFFFCGRHTAMRIQ